MPGRSPVTHVVALAVTAVLAVIGGQPAAAVVENRGPDAYVRTGTIAKWHLKGPGHPSPTYYRGRLASADGNCVYVERRNIHGDWSRLGFQRLNSNSDWVDVQYARSCDTSEIYWQVYNGPGTSDAVTGIRYVKGTYWVGNMCLGVNDCQSADLIW